MPELPEVEVLARHLAAHLPGRVIQGVQVFRAKAVRPCPPRQFVEALVAAQFQSISRRGKYLLFELRQEEGNRCLLVGHLGMTGRLYLAPGQTPLSPHVRVCLDLDGQRLIYEDPRGFGRLTLDAAPLQPLGPEPLSREFTASVLRERLRGSRQAIKVRLMNQRVVAGVGNIYASEALWRARLSPRKAAGRLTPAECQRLWKALRATLREAIACGSTIPLDFSGGGKGEKLFYYGLGESPPGRYYEERLRVYDRGGQPCFRCGAWIRRSEQGGRSTYWCPVCQR